ncbi:RAS-related protein raba4a [Phtheirospermum japonicum]|uniref:RAS-related protein raba4a n=1 Tax=Phtheirospermum japonicum TaxID=374723 RepID=A0A830C8Q6_9LAMI|nr:RAS-related protein raba4a [Phtheirospermum japonicum]
MSLVWTPRPQLELSSRRGRLRSIIGPSMRRFGTPPSRKGTSLYCQVYFLFNFEIVCLDEYSEKKLVGLIDDWV